MAGRLQEQATWRALYLLVKSGLSTAMEVAKWAFAGYGPRWKIVEYHNRHVKQEYGLEDIQLRTFTIDRVRSLRTDDGWRYLRNYYTERPYMQLNYRHGREYMVRMDSLFDARALSDAVARFFSDYRPAEELYDLNEDPGDS